MAGQREQLEQRTEAEGREAVGGVRERLAGRRVLITGTSGFLGKAVLRALLQSAPEVGGVVLPLRATDDEAARGRLAQDVLVEGAFSDLPPGALERLAAEERISAVACDLGSAEDGGSEEAMAEIDVAIHCAATVSFEEPLDDALELNSHGPSRLLRRLRAAGSEPHFVHVSTAYVADRRAGVVLEEGLAHHALAGLDAAALMRDATRWREEAERESREESCRKRFAAAARRDASQRPGMDAGERAEELRSGWVRQRLSLIGRRRALASGWPDTYAFSKALGERLVGELSTRTTMIRPTIIESALRAPRPGWLEGIKVADPLILAYASRGLTHLPGHAANVIDLVPVDLVANACIAAAAHPPQRALRTISIGSSARNPLAIGELAHQIREYFGREPLPGRDGSPIKIGELRFVERRAALRPTVRRERLAAAAARLAMASPISLPPERMLRSNRAMAERVTRMVKIYGAYTELDCVFDDANAQELARSLSPADREALPFDPAAIDWEDYLQRVHLPQVRRLATGE